MAKQSHYDAVEPTSDAEFRVRFEHKALSIAVKVPGKNAPLLLDLLMLLTVWTGPALVIWASKADITQPWMVGVIAGQLLVCVILGLLRVPATKVTRGGATG